MKTIKTLLLAGLVAGSMVNQASAINWNPRSWFNKPKVEQVQSNIQQVNQVNQAQTLIEEVNQIKQVNQAQTLVEQVNQVNKEHQENIKQTIRQNLKQKRTAMVAKLKLVLKHLMKKNLNVKTARGILVITITLAALAFGTDYATGGLVFATAKSAFYSFNILKLMNYLVANCPDFGVQSTLASAFAQANVFARPYMGQAAQYFTAAFTFLLAKTSQVINVSTPYMGQAAKYATACSTFVVANGAKAIAFAKAQAGYSTAVYTTVGLPCII